MCHNYFWWLFLTLLLAVCHPLFCHLLDSTKSPPDAYTLAAKLILSRKKNDQMPTANKIESLNQKTLGVADVEFCIMCVHIYVYTYVYMFFNICTHHGTTKHKCKMLIFRSIRRYLHFCAFWMVYIYCILYMYIIYVYVYIHTCIHMGFSRNVTIDHQHFWPFFNMVTFWPHSVWQHPGSIQSLASRRLLGPLGM